MIKIKRFPNEPIGILLKRFSKVVKQSGTLIQARKLRFRQPPKNKIEMRSAAIRREKLKQEFEKLEKLGKKPVSKTNF